MGRHPDSTPGERSFQQKNGLSTPLLLAHAANIRGSGYKPDLRAKSLIGYDLLTAMFKTWKLQTRVAELEDRIRRLEAGQKAIEVEWESVFDNVRRAMAKISKRAAREEEQTSAAGSVESASEQTQHAAMAAGLTLDPMSARIRASRRSG